MTYYPLPKWYVTDILVAYARWAGIGDEVLIAFNGKNSRLE